MHLCHLPSLLALTLVGTHPVQEEPASTGFTALAADPYVVGAFEDLEVVPGPPARVLKQTVHSSVDGASFVNLLHRADARAFRGQLISLHLPVRLETPSLDTSARLWVRVLRADGTVAFEDDGFDSASRSTEWAPLLSSGAVAEDATDLYFGLVVQGSTQVLLGSFELQLHGEASPFDARHAIPERWVHDPDVQSLYLNDPDQGLELRVTSFLPAGHAISDLPHLLVLSDERDLRQSYRDGRALLEAMRLSNDPPVIVTFVQPGERDTPGSIMSATARRPVVELIEQAMPRFSVASPRVIATLTGSRAPLTVLDVDGGSQPMAELPDLANALEEKPAVESELHATRVLLRWMAARNGAAGDAQLAGLLFDASLETLEPWPTTSLVQQSSHSLSGHQCDHDHDHDHDHQHNHH